MRMHIAGLGVSLFTALLFVTMACTDESGPRAHKSPAAVRIEGGTSEQNAALLHLNAQSAARLGIEIAVVERRPMPSFRLLPAQVVEPPGSRTEVHAPFAGTIGRIDRDRFLLALDEVEEGEAVLSLVPLLSPERDVWTSRERLDLRMLQEDAAAAVEAARIRREGVQLELDRSERLAADEVGSQRRLEEARTAVQLAEAAIEAAIEAALKRKERLAAAEQEAEPSADPTPLPIAAPRSGLIEDVLVRPGQAVAAGAVLFRIRDHRASWLRVAVYAGELDTLDLEGPARISELADLHGEHSFDASPKSAPLALVSAASSVDLFYAPDSETRVLRVGERLLAHLPRKGPDTALVLPWSALLFDASGNAWVYLREAETSYRRAAVLLTRREGESAVLERGPAVGAEVVIAGGAELFGTEFGTGK